MFFHVKYDGMGNLGAWLDEWELMSWVVVEVTPTTWLEREVFITFR